jgi:maleylpyruvate isomerase
MSRVGVPLRVYRIPFSTNVERVALAAAYKGVELEWIDVDAADRSPVVAASGQPLVPVLDHDGRIAFDSTAILYYLDELQPEPLLFRSPEIEVFVDWFNHVWKGPPNEIEAERGAPEPDEAGIAELGAEITGALDLFERLLAGRDHLFGEFSAADCAAFPFLKYALDDNEDDDEPFHQILREFQPLGDEHARLAAWIRCVDGYRARRGHEPGAVQLHSPPGTKGWGVPPATRRERTPKTRAGGTRHRAEFVNSEGRGQSASWTKRATEPTTTIVPTPSRPILTHAVPICVEIPNRNRATVRITLTIV